MERITNKNFDYIRYYAQERHNFTGYFDLFAGAEKLKRIENIEEELGCPLDVLFKAFKNGIWFINKQDELEYIDESLGINQKKYNNKFIFDNYGYRCKNNEVEKSTEIYLEDYKKTWWLKEDKSE